MRRILAGLFMFFAIWNLISGFTYGALRLCNGGHVIVTDHGMVITYWIVLGLSMACIGAAAIVGLCMYLIFRMAKWIED